MFDNLDDPRKQALLMMAAGLLSPVRGKGMSGFGEAMGQGIRGGLLGFNSASQNKRRDELTDIQKKHSQMQLAEAERAQRFNQAAFKPGIGAPPLTPNDDEGNPMPSPNTTFDRAAAAAIDPYRAFMLEQQINKPRTPIVSKPGEVGRDPVTGTPLWEHKAEQKAPEMPSLMQYERILSDPAATPQQKAIAKAYIDKATSHGPAANVTTNVMPPREVFKDSMALKKDFDGVPEVKGFKEVRSAWDQISTALSNPSAANDMAAATKFMKLLDPGSVVRESELMMAMQASGVLDRMANYHKRLMSGEKLTPTQREDFYKSGKALYDAAKSRYDETVTQYEGIAKQYKLDPSFIYRGKERLQKNTTATVRAREAIKSGAPRDQVVKRLIEEGFDPEGL